MKPLPLDIPAELAHLMEKRELPERRTRARRKTSDRRQPAGNAANGRKADAAGPGGIERRTKENRRASAARRKKARRTGER